MFDNGWIALLWHSFSISPPSWDSQIKSAARTIVSNYKIDFLCDFFFFSGGVIQGKIVFFYYSEVYQLGLFLQLKQFNCITSRLGKHNSRWSMNKTRRLVTNWFYLIRPNIVPKFINNSNFFFILILSFPLAQVSLHGSDVFVVTQINVSNLHILILDVIQNKTNLRIAHI